ncbi:MAG: DUF4412 domain-containing protein [Cyclobacteriaceae bacterium]
MKTNITLILAGAFFLLSWDAFSQFGRLRDAASRGVSRAIEKTVESQVEKATRRQLEKAFEDLYSDADSTNPDGSSNPGYDFNKVMGSINMNVETESAYDFSGLAVLEIINTDAKGKTADPLKFNSFLSEGHDYFGMEILDEKNQKEGEKTIMIFDHKNNATIMLMENEEGHSSMAFALDWEGLAEGTNTETVNSTENLDNVQFEKTGNTKDILGYTCDEYLVDHEDMKGNYWVSQSPIEGMESFWGKNSPFLTKKMKAENKSYFETLPDGNVLEMDFLNKEDQSRSQMKFIEIDRNNRLSFNMKDYPNAMKAAK